MRPPVAFIKQATPTLVAGRPHSLFYLGGMPGAAAAPSPGIAGAALTTYSGQIPWTNPGAGNSYLARLQAASSGGAGTLVLCDRLWHNSGLNLTIATAQTINSVAFPARDSNGSTDGDQVQVALEVTTATGAGTPALSMTYTNSAGTASRVGAGLIAGVATSAIGAFYPMVMAAGDVGVRSIQNFTLSATWTSGAASLVAYREIARLDILASGAGTSVDALTSGFPRLYDNSTLFCYFLPANTTATVIAGSAVVTQG
jgi:hypothetical protein